MKTPILFALALILSIGALAQEADTLSKAAEKTIAVPTTIDFQGRLHDSGGNPVNASLSIKFSLYDLLSGGTALWTETKTVQVTDGLFQVKLGEITPFTQTHFSGTDRWLGIKVGAEAEMSPRTKISSVGYAMQALETDPTWNGTAELNSPVGRMGRVGVGINVPEFDLHVVGAPSTDNYGVITVEGIKESGYTGAEFRAKINGNFAASFGSDSNEDYIFGFRNDKPLKIYTSQNERMRITAGGLIGMGTQTPTALLHTEGIGIGQGNVLFKGQFKQTEPGEPPTIGQGTRMMWYPDKAAFRVGHVNSNQWDQSNIGDFSVAIGFSNLASGENSTAIGGETKASGATSTAMGYYTIASGIASTAMGNETTASGKNSTAMGKETTASGEYSTSMGSCTTASGNISTALGFNTRASSYAGVVFGRNNFGGGNATYWVSTDPVFEIGIGDGQPNNALTVLKNGNMGLGTHTPNALLHINGTGTGQGNVVFVGSYKSTPGPPPVTGGGTRLMWYPDKAAFRAGYVGGNQWDEGNVGYYSTAMGEYTIAKGGASTALGTYSTASGETSIAMGSYTTASGSNSTAMGNGTTASGQQSTAMGYYTTASGYAVTAIGRYNIGGGSATSWLSTDPIFEIGIGSGDASRNNAMTVLKNGNVGIGTHTPGQKLHVNGISRLSSHLIGANELELNEYGSGNRNTYIDFHCDATYTDYALRLIRYDGGANADSRLHHRGTGMMQFYAQEAATIAFYNTGTERARISSTGNFGLGTTSPGYKLTVNGTAWCSSGAWSGSDIRWKKDIDPLGGVLPQVLALQPVHFSFRTEEFPEMQFSTERQVGLIAQEVEKIFPELVSTDNNGFKAVAYDKLSVLLLEAVKEQQVKIERLEAENENLRQNDQQLKGENDQMNARLERLERALESLSER